MRMRTEYYWLLLTVLSLLLSIMNINGYPLIRRHHHKRMTWPQKLYEDFAAINCAAGRKNGVQVQNTDLVAAVGEPNSGASGGAFNTQCGGESEKKQCDVKQIFGNGGDPKLKTSCIALKAAQDAKAANDAQMAAGQLAAQHIKQELAEKAFQSAKAAEAALNGKQMVVQQLEQEMQEANAVVAEESASLQNTESNMNAAVEAARAATQQFETLTELQRTVKDNLANIQSVALGSQQELSTKVQLLEAAKNRLGSLQSQLQGAREDYEKTKQAAYKAACAAVEAKQKAANTNSYRKRRRQRNRLPRHKSAVN